MKKTVVFLLLAAVLLSITACKPSNPVSLKFDSKEIGMEAGGTYSAYEGIAIQITGAVRNEDCFSLKVEWINKTSYESFYGTTYTIERKEGEEWVSCQSDEELVFTMVAYILSPGQTQEKTYNVSRAFDVSKAGTYRFRSDITVKDGTNKSANQTVWAEFTVTENQTESESKTQESVDYGVQYIRTNGYQDGAQFPKVVIIRSQEELNTYYNKNRETFDLERKDKVYSDTTIGFLDACDRYDEAYFEKGYLMFVLLEEGSGSVHHKVTGSTISSDGELGIYIDAIVPEVGTADMAEWHIILEFSNSAKVKDENHVQVYLDGRLAFDKGAVVPQKVILENQNVMREPPAVKFLYESGGEKLLPSGYSWYYPNGEGTMTGICADHLHPLACKDTLKPVYVKGEYVKLAFEDEPDSVAIQCWPDTAWNDTDAVSGKIDYSDGAFTQKTGGYIYEIIAKWNESKDVHSGSVSYYVYIVGGE